MSRHAAQQVFETSALKAKDLNLSFFCFGSFNQARFFQNLEETSWHFSRSKSGKQPHKTSHKHMAYVRAMRNKRLKKRLNL